MTKHSQHRPTPTQRLRAEIDRLTAENAVLAAKSTAEDESVYERRFPVSGHVDGAAAYVAMHRFGNTWAVIDSNAGHRAPSWFDGRHWHDLDGRAPRNAMYRFTRERAKELAERFAAEAAERHHRNALLAQARQAGAVAA